MLKRGTQIAYIPRHANLNIHHPDVEFGFVTSVRKDFAFCRYWSKYNPGELRTKANSEATPLDMLIEHESMPQLRVHEELRIIEEWDKRQGI